jgi:plasmid stability protein
LVPRGAVLAFRPFLLLLTSRKQLSMVLPLDLIAAIKRRAAEQGLSITAYVSALVRRDLDLPQSPDPRALAQQLDQLRMRVDQLERQDDGL